MSRRTGQKQERRQQERVGAKVTKRGGGRIEFAFNRTYSPNPIAPPGAESPAEHRTRMDRKHRRADRLKRQQAALLARLERAGGRALTVRRASMRSNADLRVLVEQAEKYAAQVQSAKVA
jgi:hypothetical protein